MFRDKEITVYHGTGKTKFVIRQGLRVTEIVVVARPEEPATVRVMNDIIMNTNGRSALVLNNCRTVGVQAQPAPENKRDASAPQPKI